MESVQTRRVDRVIDFDLGEPEINEMSRNAAELSEAIESDEDAFKLVKKDWNGKIKEKKKQVRDIMRAIKSGHQERDLVCMEIMNWKDGTVTYTELPENTPEGQEPKILEERAMTEEEKQMNFATDDEPKKPKRGRQLKAVDSDFEAPQPGDDDIGDVMREQTSRRTARSSVDPVQDQP